MQRLLTEEEYEALISQGDVARRECRDTIQKLCTEVANTKPIIPGWVTRRGEEDDYEPKPWGCILNKEPLNHPGYCDECPVQDECPCTYKEWSN
jgi:hypothetical protein